MQFGYAACEYSLIRPLKIFLQWIRAAACAARHRAVDALSDADERTATLRQTIADCDTKIKNYRAALDAGGDPTLIAGWIKETTTLRNATQAMLGAQRPTPKRMTEDEISKIVEGLGGLLGLLRQADPQDRAEFTHASACS